jgi:prefoldin subunit 5
MSESVEKLQKIDEHVQSALAPLTQADQALEQALAVYEEYSRTAKNPADLRAALTAIRGRIHELTDAHNQLTGEIKQAQEDAAKEKDEDPYE